LLTYALWRQLGNMYTLIPFTKMHGLGNDFVVLDNIRQSLKMDTQLAKKIADRHLGIGCDQVLVVEPPSSPDVDFDYRIFNADGNEVMQCGNGARCLARYIHDHGLTDKKTILLATQSTKMSVSLEDLLSIEVNMGIPRFEPNAIPFQSNTAEPLGPQGRYRIQLSNQSKDITVMSLGNPHCTLTVPSLNEVAINELGAALQQHPAFVDGVNVSFLQVLAKNHAKCRVFERGVGETQACGSAACAAVMAGIIQNELNHEVQVDMLGGSLTVRWIPEQGLLLSGATASVFHGDFALFIPPEVF